MSDNEKAIDRKIKKIDFLRTIGANPERKLDDVSKELGMTSNTAFRWLQEFIENAVMTDNEPHFPRKLLLFYNKGLPENEQGLMKSDVDQLRGILKIIMKEIYQKHRFRKEETIS